MAFYDVQNFPRGFPRKHSKASCIRKSYSGRSRAHLAASTEWVSSQTNESCLCKSISPFTVGLYGSPCDYVIHVGLIATSHVSLITSFQPPLTLRLLRGLHVSDVSGYLIISVKVSCRNITCESIPGCPPPFLFFVGAKGEPGNKAREEVLHVYILFHTLVSLWLGRLL